MKCGYKENFNIDKLNYGKIIILSDADQDGSHIATLLLTLQHDYFKPLLDHGKVYIAQPPLYRATKVNKDPVYLRDEAALNEFFLRELENNFSFIKDGKKASEKVKTLYISRMREYVKDLEEFANSLGSNPHVVELALLQTFTDDDNIWNFDNKINLDVDDNNLISINGFIQVIENKKIEEEYFIAINKVEFESFFEKCKNLFDKLTSIVNMEIEIFHKDNEYNKSTLFSLFSSMETKSQSFVITRFKGLGEANYQELSWTTLKPETRTIVKVLPTDNADSIIEKLMGKNSEPKKVFITNAFTKKLDIEKLDI